MRFCRKLRLRGVLDLVVPNFVSLTVCLAWMFQSTTKAADGTQTILPMLTGEQDYRQNVHQSQWRLRLLKAYLGRHGFLVKEVRGEFKVLFLSFLLKKRATVLQLKCLKV